MGAGVRTCINTHIIQRGGKSFDYILNSFKYEN